jgi:hypothetical protein
MNDDAWPAPRPEPLEASLRELEALEAFRREAQALRRELWALRSAEPSWTAPRYDVPRRGIPGVVLRLAAESALIVSVAVIAGVAHLRALVIVALMAAAFAITALSEWLASRSSFVPPAFAFLPPPAEADEPELVDALTVVVPRPDPWEHDLEHVPG